MKKAEIQQINADMRWWQQITERIDSWTLLGFTFREGATFITDGDQTLSLTGTQAKRLIEYFEYSEDQWDGG